MAALRLRRFMIVAALTTWRRSQRGGAHNVAALTTWRRSQHDRGDFYHLWLLNSRFYVWRMNRDNYYRIDADAGAVCIQTVWRTNAAGVVCRLCVACRRYVARDNVHCSKCNACTTKVSQLRYKIMCVQDWISETTWTTCPCLMKNTLIDMFCDQVTHA